MNQLVFFLEEPSAEAMLSGLLPRILPDGVTTRFIVFEGKSDLDRQLARRLRGYRVPGARFIVLRDKDAGDCLDIKRALVHICRQADHEDALVRIACHELESWYLADLAAVEKGLGVEHLAVMQERTKFRSPDGLANPAQVLEEITARRYQKVGGSRAIGPLLDPDNTRSRSFAVFVSGVRRMASGA